MVKVNGKNYTADYIQKAVAALEAAGVQDEGTDNIRISLCNITEKGEIKVTLSLDEYHSVFVDLEADADQCRTLQIKENLPKDGGVLSLPLATIEVPDARTDYNQQGKGGYPIAAGKPAGCPRIFLYDRLMDECSHIVLVDDDGMNIINN